MNCHKTEKRSHSGAWNLLTDHTAGRPRTHKSFVQLDPEISTDRFCTLRHWTSLKASFGKRLEVLLLTFNLFMFNLQSNSPSVASKAKRLPIPPEESSDLIFRHSFLIFSIFLQTIFRVLKSIFALVSQISFL